MSAEPLRAPPSLSRQRSQAARAVVGALADGTPFYAPIGEVVADGAWVMCHLCGRPLRSIPAHLRVHGWTADAYRTAFGLERGQSLESPQTRKRRAVAFSTRLVLEPAVREGSAAGRARARTGELTRDATAAATGRPIPLQRRRKAVQVLSAIPRGRIAQANRDRARQHVEAVAAAVARRRGYPDIGTFVLDRVAAGDSLAAISRQAGLDKDWICRNLPALDPQAAAAARQQAPSRWDIPWQPVLHRLGFPDLPSYLRQRHTAQHRTVHAIAVEAGLTPGAVQSAMRRHGIARTLHATKRHTARERAAQVAQRFGFASITGYVSDRRSAGWKWQAIADESGQPVKWLRRHSSQPGTGG